MVWSLLVKGIDRRLPCSSYGKEPACNQETYLGSILGSGLEKVMATLSCILTWRMPWTEEPGGYSPWGLKELGTTEQLSVHTHTHTHTHTHGKRCVISF